MNIAPPTRPRLAGPPSPRGGGLEPLASIDPDTWNYEVAAALPPPCGEVVEHSISGGGNGVNYGRPNAKAASHPHPNRLRLLGLPWSGAQFD